MSHLEHTDPHAEAIKKSSEDSRKFRLHAEELARDNEKLYAAIAEVKESMKIADEAHRALVASLKQDNERHLKDKAELSANYERAADNLVKEQLSHTLTKKLVERLEKTVENQKALIENQENHIGTLGDRAYRLELRLRHPWKEFFSSLFRKRLS